MYSKTVRDHHTILGKIWQQMNCHNIGATTTACHVTIFFYNQYPRLHLSPS
jgi:hypothetical protein